MEDAELYLSHLGIPRGLPKLDVRFGSRIINGSASQFKKADGFHQRAPEVNFSESWGQCCLLLLDPDAPDRSGDGSRPGKFGPWLHWLVADCRANATSGHELTTYMGPAPPKGNHRYIFILFQQSGEVACVSEDRKAWDFPAFMKANPGLSPAAINFFYVSAH
eukprot:TRINITY_DN44085_c0_g1_i1.p1 TRINITY_DN44085_c0_g1~~TRINITY_DN44085_c0_g1_i1.p1  ORF type:complete len:182 (-),score=23.53 TRINITY_DN44085_c0_g1_i1:256-744(-)